jgi:hypothetical protein
MLWERWQRRFAAFLGGVDCGSLLPLLFVTIAGHLDGGNSDSKLLHCI